MTEKKPSLVIGLVTLLTLLLQAWNNNEQSKQLAAAAFDKERMEESELVLAENYREFVLDVMARCDCTEDE